MPLLQALRKRMEVTAVARQRRPNGSVEGMGASSLLTTVACDNEFKGQDKQQGPGLKEGLQV